MPRYRVEYKETRTHVVEIEADDTDDAGERATEAEGDPISDQFDSVELILVEEIAIEQYGKPSNDPCLSG